MKTKILNDIESLKKGVPHDIVKNIEFRMELHKWLSGDSEAQNTYIRLLLSCPQLAYDTLFWTLDSRRPAGERVRPFILRPAQRESVDKLKYAVDNSRDFIINKSRDEGATEIIIKYISLLFLFVPQTHIIVGSRSEDLVDKSGDPDTLFARIDQVIKYLPSWLKNKLGWEEKNRNHLHIELPEIETSVDGKTTNEHFSAGGRATLVFLDEFGRVKPNLARDILHAVNDVSNCILFNSTHKYGIDHPFAQTFLRDDIIKTTLLWTENPEKNQGLYYSPQIGKIQIKDIEYYRKVLPEVFNSIEPMQTLELSELEKEINKYKSKEIKFVADGCEEISGNCRSPWHDAECKRRRYDKRDIAMNIWADACGSANMIFDADVLNKIRATCTNPKYVGIIDYKLTDNGIVEKESFSFKRDYGRRDLKIWKNLINERLDQNHNYIIGCDISQGTGASNSVAAIYDVNTKELVGILENPNLLPDVFANIVVSLGYWVSGKSGKAFLIWENNGGQGQSFGKQILRNGYNFCYEQKTESKKKRKRQNVWGWTSNNQKKDSLLSELRIALSSAVKMKEYDNVIKAIIYYESLVDELTKYIYSDTGEPVSSEYLDESVGARAKHGDAVIALGLCILALKDQPKAAAKETHKIGRNSYLERKRIWRKQNKKDLW